MKRPSLVKLIFNTVESYNFVIKEFNLTYEVQNMANGTFQIVPFGNVPFPNVPFECSCLWAMSLKFGNEIVSSFEQGRIHIECFDFYIHRMCRKI